MAAMTKLNLNELLLLSGNDIPFPSAQICIHPPTIKEIALIGEEKFFMGCELLKFSKDILSPEDKNNLSQISDFNILMTIMNEHSPATEKNVESAFLVLSLIFPNYQIQLEQHRMVFLQPNEPNHYLDENNFNEFKEIINYMFCLKKFGGKEDFNPSGELAKRIAEKMARGRQQAAAARPQKKIAIFSRYISILAVGEKKDINQLLNYTIYQLFDEYQRFELKQAYDIFIKSRLAGATKTKEPENWMKDLYEDQADSWDDLKTI